MLEGQLLAVHPEGHERLAPIEGGSGGEARGPVVDAAPHELLGGARDLVLAHARFLQYVGEQDTGPASVGDQPAADFVGDAR